MKVLIIGLPQFAKNLTGELKAFDPDNQYVCLNTYYSFFDKLRFLYHVRNCDLVYSLNGSIYNARAFDMAIKLNTKLIIHWVGTDVLKAEANHQKGKINPLYMDRATHFCEVDWIKEELKAIGISAEPVHFLSFDSNRYESVPLPQKFSLLTYIGLNRADFYGFNEILTLAKNFPGIEINVVGMNEFSEDIPENVNLLGWVDDVAKAINDSVACIRFPQHDGLSGFVLESLASGRHVIYKYPFPHCLHAKDQGELEEITKSLYDRFSNGSLEVNTEGEVYIKENFNREKVLNNLLNKFKTVINER